MIRKLVVKFRRVQVFYFFLLIGFMLLGLIRNPGQSKMVTVYFWISEESWKWANSIKKNDQNDSFVHFDRRC